MDWTPISPQRLSWLHWDSPAELQRLDPYLLWADLTGFAGYSGVGSFAQKVPLVIELKPGGSLQALVDAQLIEVPPCLCDSAPSIGTGYAQAKNLGRLAARVKHLELGLPLPYTWNPSWGLLTERTAAAPKKFSDRTVIGVIDLDCAFLNRVFRQPGDITKTRLLGLWHQGGVAVAPWVTPRGFGYGRELDRSAINQLLATGAVSVDPAAEQDAYQSLAYLHDAQGQLERKAHGTHVLDVAGGCVQGPATSSSAKPGLADRAQDCDLVFVHVPRAPRADTTGASLCAHLIDAMHYVVDRAGDAAHIVVNLSIGAQAGPHDGQSLIERAIDELVAARREAGQTLAVVMSAGNGYRSECHAQGTIAPNGTASFGWRIRPEDDTDSFLELWFDRESGSGIEVEFTSPRGESSGGVSVGKAQMLDGADGAVCSVVFCNDAPTGPGPLALLAMGPTRASPRRSALAAHGLWTVCVSNSEPTPLVFHAWVERDDPPVGAPDAKRQSSLVDLGPVAFVTGAGTLNNIATGTEPVVVGASVKASGQMSDYSAKASGLSRRNRAPDALACADESVSFSGLQAAGVLSGQRYRMGGTSVSAPVLARQLANLLMRRGTAAGAVMSKSDLLALLTPATRLTPVAGSRAMLSLRSRELPPSNDPGGLPRVGL